MKTRIETTLLFIGCVFRFLLRGPARACVTEPASIIIMQTTTNIGDMVFCTPMFRAIKNKYPHCRVYVVGTAKNRELLEGNVDVDEYIIDTGTLALLKKLATIRPSFGCVVHPHVRNLELLYLAGLPAIAAFSIETPLHFPTRTYSWLKKLVVQIPFERGKQFSQEYLKLLTPVGIQSLDVTKHLAVDSKEVMSVQKIFRAHGVKEGMPVIALTPGAGREVKVWPTEYFLAFSKQITKVFNAAILIIGGTDDVPAYKLIRGELPPMVPVINGCGGSLARLKAFLHETDLIVANDTGPAYVAEAFGAGTVLLVGPTDEREHPLQDETHTVVLPSPRGKMYASFDMDGFPAPDEARKQMENIHPEKVLEAARRVLGGLGF